MPRTAWTSTLAWLTAVAAAFLFAWVAPSDSTVMGQLPTHTIERLERLRLTLPEGLNPSRTLALVTFSRSQRPEIDSWIQGMGLNQDSRISWFRLPVMQDPGNDDERTAMESRLLARHGGAGQASRLVPLFTHRDAFIRAAGLSGLERAGVLVLNEEGKILARAEGPFDQDKALALQETLLSSGQGRPLRIPASH